MTVVGVVFVNPPASVGKTTCFTPDCGSEAAVSTVNVLPAPPGR